MISESRIQELQKHMELEHRRSPLAVYIQEVVYGGVDGIITTFAIVAGFTGASLSNEATTQLSFVIVLLFGLANLLADGISMGVGNFLSVRSDQGVYKKVREKERTEIQRATEAELEETVTILILKGFSEEDAYTLARIYSTNEEYWLDFMMNHELKMSDPTVDNPVYTGFATFLSFVCFGLIPLIPFIFFGSSYSTETVFKLSSGGTFTALVLLGVLKWRIIKVKPLRTIFEIVLVGGLAATVAFIVGSLFTL